MPITLGNTIKRGLIGNEWGNPTIYIDPNTNEIAKSNKITAIGVFKPAADPAVLPANTTVIQVGSNVKEVHYIQVQDDIIPPDIFKYAINVTDFGNVFTDTDIKKIPDGLFNSCTKATNFMRAFAECRLLRTIPANLFDHCPNVTSFKKTFYKCQSLKSIPDGLFDHCVNVRTFESAFDECMYLSVIPSGLFSQCSNAINFNNTFFDCRRLKEIPASLFEHCTKATDFYSTFEGCVELASVPKGLFDGCSSVTSFARTFGDCLSLKSIPEDLFQNNPKVTSFEGTFSNCKQLKGKMPIVTAPDGKQYKLWELEQVSGYPRYIKGSYCFSNCKKLPEYPEIPDTWSDLK